MLSGHGRPHRVVGGGAKEALAYWNLKAMTSYIVLTQNPYNFC